MTRVLVTFYRGGANTFKIFVKFWMVLLIYSKKRLLPAKVLYKCSCLSFIVPVLLSFGNALTVLSKCYIQRWTKIFNYMFNKQSYSMSIFVVHYLPQIANSYTTVERYRQILNSIYFGI